MMLRQRWEAEAPVGARSPNSLESQHGGLIGADVARRNDAIELLPDGRGEGLLRVSEEQVK